jgi:hypothetical protein
VVVRRRAPALRATSTGRTGGALVAQIKASTPDCVDSETLTVDNACAGI